MGWLASRTTYHDKLFALVDRTRRGAGAPLIQRGADDVVSHLLGPAVASRPVATARDLVVLPEDIGLMAIFTGPRGAVARAVPPQGGVTAGIGAVLAGYTDQIAYYAARYPALLRRPLPTRLIGLAGTDTFARVAVETFAELARHTHAYLEAGVNMARSWQVVCSDRAHYRAPPGAGRCAVQDPARVALLRGPDEPGRDYAYEATTDVMANMALVFDPAGNLISQQVKTYLTPVEAPDQLDLVPGEVSGGLSPVRTPVGALGFVTSKDSWMPDVTAKLDEGHVDLLVQPEFFVGDTVRSTGMWAPDNLLASGYSDLLRHPSFRAMALAEMTGSVYDLSADAQQHIAVKPVVGRRPRGALVGQSPSVGLLRVAPWLVPDPLSASEGTEQRRHRLARAGEAALPLGGGPACSAPDVAGPCRGGQVEGVIWADVDVGARPRRVPRRRVRHGRTPFSINRPIAPSPRSQRNVRIAARRGAAWAVFEERRGGHDQVLLARSSDHGRTWGTRLVHPTGRRPGGAQEQWPSISVGADGRVWIAWQDDSSGVMRVYAAGSRDGGRTFSVPRAVAPDAPRGVAQLHPSIAATTTGRAVVAFVDERGRNADGLPQAQARLARLDARGSVVPSLRVSTGEPVALARQMNNAWAPDVVARSKRVLVSWIDFHTYDWRVYSRLSADGGQTLAPATPVSADPGAGGTEPDPEALTDTPRGAFTGDGPLVAYTDYRKRVSSQVAPHQLYDIAVATPGRRPVQIDGNGTTQRSSFAPAIAGSEGIGATVVWQDHARGDADVLIRFAVGEGAVGAALRVDDAGAIGWNSWRPDVAFYGGTTPGVLVCWEDDRDGPSQIFCARASDFRLEAAVVSARWRTRATTR
jgi:hypothetical protein